MLFQNSDSSGNKAAMNLCLFTAAEQLRSEPRLTGSVIERPLSQMTITQSLLDLINRHELSGAAGAYSRQHAACS